jgi:hypothetical protein
MLLKIGARLTVTLILIALMSSSSSAQDAWRPDTQVDNFLFNLPDGWEKIDTKDGPTLIPKDLPKGGACFIGFMPSQRLKGSIRSEFNAEWAQFQRRFRVSQAGEITSERNKNGFDLLRIDARIYNPQFGYSEFVFAMAQGGDREEGYYWINNTGYYSYRISLEDFEHSLQFANHPAAPAPASAPAQGTGGGVNGLYVGHKMRGLIGLETHFEYLVFFRDGNVIRYLPEEGLGKFDFRIAVRSSRDYCGRYGLRNNRISIMWGNDQAETATYAGKSFKIGGDSYFPAPDVTGLKLSGIYRREGADMAQYFIRFTPDGRFAENGMLSPLAYSGSNTSPGRGTYSIDDYTLHLNYADGRRVPLSFFIFPEDDLQSRNSIHVNTYLLLLQK